MIAISVFDGMSCGRLAFQRAGIPITKYYCSEIDKQAVKFTKTKFPDNIHLGDVSKVRYENGILYCEHGEYEVPHVDYFIGGSPCQGFSFAGKGLNFEDPRSKLFFEYVRILNEIKKSNPNIKFLLENVQMKYQHVQVITSYMGVEPICINSSLLSAQNRVRLYWTNIGLEKVGLFDEDFQCTINQPEDKNIFLRDILQPEKEVDKKYYISKKALERIQRKVYSMPQINPEKTGALNTKNNSGQLSVDSGTTLDQRGVLNDNGELKETEKANCLDANYFKSMDNHAQRSMVVSSFRQDEPTSIDAHKHPCLRAEAGGIGRGIGIIYKDGRTKADQDKAGCQTAGANTAGNHSDMNVIIIPKKEVIQLNDSNESGNKEPYQQNRIYDVNGASPALNAGLAAVPKIAVPNDPLIVHENTKKGFVEINDGECVDMAYPNSATPRGRRMEDKSNALLTQQQSFMYWKNFTLRRLTPIECCRLQTVDDSYFFDDNGKQIISDSSIYKCLGNGWTIDVIAYILSHNL